MHVPAGLGEQRRHVTGRALRFSVEYCLAASCGNAIEAAIGRRGRGDGKLIKVKRRKLRGNQIGSASNIRRACLRGYGKLDQIIQSRIKEGSLAVHLEV